MRTIHFQDGPLAGETREIGRIISDKVDVPIKNGEYRVHRYQIATRDDGTSDLDATFVVTMGGD